MEEKEMKRAILVGVQLQNDNRFPYSMEELKNLAIACDIEVIHSFVQKGDATHSSKYVGKGKLEEILEYVEAEDIDLVIFNDELSPSQLVNIEEMMEVEVLDRTSLILNIFARRAKTKEALLQVEISKLKYTLPRLEGLRPELGRQGGGSSNTNRGAGETQLELDKRRIEAQINQKERSLKKLVSERQTRRERRTKKNLKTVALVGYTNAGKSTLMNTIADATGNEKQVFAENMLFATLETRVRRMELQDKKEFLLTDTVGFVDKLPHHLVKAFQSTLEEVKEADLLLHVVDYSSPYYLEQMKITLETLKSIGIEGIPLVEVYNKCDLTDAEIPKVQNDKIWLSATKAIGIDELLDLIKEKIFSDYQEVSLFIPYADGHIVSLLNEKYDVTLMENTEAGVLMTLDCPPIVIDQYRKYMVE